MSAPRDSASCATPGKLACAKDGVPAGEAVQQQDDRRWARRVVRARDVDRVRLDRAAVDARRRRLPVARLPDDPLSEGALRHVVAREAAASQRAAVAVAARQPTGVDGRPWQHPGREQLRLPLVQLARGRLQDGLVGDVGEVGHLAGAGRIAETGQRLDPPDTARDGRERKAGLDGVGRRVDRRARPGDPLRALARHDERLVEAGVARGRPRRRVAVRVEQQHDSGHGRIDHRLQLPQHVHRRTVHGDPHLHEVSGVARAVRAAGGIGEVTCAVGRGRPAQPGQRGGVDRGLRGRSVAGAGVGAGVVERPVLEHQLAATDHRVAGDRRPRAPPGVPEQRRRGQLLRRRPERALVVVAHVGRGGARPQQRHRHHEQERATPHRRSVPAASRNAR